MFLLFLVACSGDSAAEARYAAAHDAVAHDDEAAARALIDAIPDATERDMVRIRLATDFPRKAADLCNDAKADFAVQRCQQVLGRPHLRGRK